MNPEPPARADGPGGSGAPDTPALTKLSGLALWAGLVLFAVLLTTGHGQDPIALSLQAQLLFGRSGSFVPGASPVLEQLVLWMPLLSLAGFVALAFAWFFLYRFFQSYLLPILFLDARPPERGPDIRTRLGLRCVQRAFILLAAAALLRIAPGLLGQIVPQLSRVFGGSGF